MAHVFFWYGVVVMCGYGHVFTFYVIIYSLASLKLPLSYVPASFTLPVFVIVCPSLISVTGGLYYEVELTCLGYLSVTWVDLRRYLQS